MVSGSEVVYQLHEFIKWVHSLYLAGRCGYHRKSSGDDWYTTSKLEQDPPRYLNGLWITYLGMYLGYLGMGKYVHTGLNRETSRFSLPVHPLSNLNVCIFHT